MKKIITTAIALVCLFTATMNAQNTKKGFYFSAELGTNANFDSKFFYDRAFVKRNISLDPESIKNLIPVAEQSMWTKERLELAGELAEENLEAFEKGHIKDVCKKDKPTHTSVDVNAKLAFGYRVCNQFVVAGGTGVYLSTNSQMATFSIPLFLRLRSDFLNGNFSPYAELDLGYAFMIKNSVIDEDHLGMTYEKDFGNGNFRGTNFIDYDILRNGLFGEFTLGVGWVVGNQRRISLGVGVDLAQCMRGVVMCSKDGYHAYTYEEGKVLNATYSPSNSEWWKEENGFPTYNLDRETLCSVFSYGEVKNESFKNQFHLGLNFKIAFEF